MCLLFLYILSLCFWGCRDGAVVSTRLPPMWPGFDSQIRRQMWVEFVGSLLCTERFSLVLIVNLSYSAVSLVSAPALEKTRHLNKVPYLTLPFYPRAAASSSTVWALQQPHKQSLHHSVQLLRSLPRALARASSQQKTRPLSWRMVC